MLTIGHAEGIANVDLERRHAILAASPRKLLASYTGHTKPSGRYHRSTRQAGATNLLLNPSTKNGPRAGQFISSPRYELFDLRHTKRLDVTALPTFHAASRLSLCRPRRTECLDESDANGRAWITLEGCIAEWSMCRWAYIGRVGRRVKTVGGCQKVAVCRPVSQRLPNGRMAEKGVVHVAVRGGHDSGAVWRGGGGYWHLPCSMSATRGLGGEVCLGLILFCVAVDCGLGLSGGAV